MDIETHREIRGKYLLKAPLQVMNSILNVVAYFRLWPADGEEAGGKALVVFG